MKKTSASLAAMEARSVSAIPEGPEWQYEPKWDGFRCILRRDGDAVAMLSKSGQDLSRYFPEIVTAALFLREELCSGRRNRRAGQRQFFVQRLQRIHPAASRVRKLAAENPALYLAFDLLKEGKKEAATKPLLERRPLLEDFAKHQFVRKLRFSAFACRPQIEGRVRQAGRRRRRRNREAFGPSQAGTREGMQKIKKYRRAD